MRNSIIRFLSILVFSLSILVLYGAGAEEKEMKILRIWDFKYNDSRTQRIFNRIDNLFREIYPEIILEHTGFNDEEYIPALRSALLAGTAPDIIWLHQGAEFIEYQSYLEPLDDFLSTSDLRFRTSSLDLCRTEEGVVKSLPLSFQGMGWYYNKKLFEEAGLNPHEPPADWNEFLETCRILKEHGITPIAAGNNRPLTTDFIRRSLMTAFFSDLEIGSFFDHGRGIQTPEFRMIMEFCLYLRDAGYLDPNGIFRPYFNFAIDSFGSGQAAMIIGLLSDISHWQEYSKKLGNDNVGYFPNLRHGDMERPGAQLIQDAGILAGINRNSNNREYALKYLEVLFSEKAQRLLVDDLGMLVPLEELRFPVEKYPVLLDIEAALENTGYDIEQFTPSTYVRDMIYRYDRLLINSREISLNDYIDLIYNRLMLF